MCFRTLYLAGLLAPSLLFPAEPSFSSTGHGPGAWLGLQGHKEYYALSLGIPLVRRGGSSLGLDLGWGGYSPTNEDAAAPEGVRSKSGFHLGFYTGRQFFWGLGAERIKRTDAHLLAGPYWNSSYETTETRTGAYLLVGYRSQAGLGIYLHGGGVSGIGLGLSVHL
jgi:hypothetical protein